MRAATSTQLTITKVDYSIREGHRGKFDNETDHDHDMYGLQ